jgi:MFS family permease
MNLKKWFTAFGLQGAAIGAASLTISLFAVYGLKGNVRSASIATALFSLGNLSGSILVTITLDKIKNFSPIIFIAFLLSTASLAFIPFVRTIQVYFLFTFILGIAISIVGPALTLHLNRTLDDLVYRRGINFLNMFNSYGITFGMLSGSFILTAAKSISEIDKMRFVFIFSAFVLAIAAMISIEREEKEITIRVKPSIKSTKAIFSKVIRFPKEVFSLMNIKKFPGPIKLFILSVFLTFFGANIFLSVFSIYLKQYVKITSQSIFLLYAINNFASNIAFLITGRISSKERDAVLVKSVVYFRAFSILAIAILSLFKIGILSMAIIGILFVLFGLSWPFLYLPLTIAAGELCSQRERGKIFGLFNIAINAAVISASFLAGTLALKFNYVVTFIVGTIILLFGGISFSRLFKTHAN